MLTAHRPVVMGTQGMVVSGHPAAALAGSEMLRQGGNAVDAAVASAAALSVALPYMNGLGGDAIGVVYERATRKVIAVNATGAAPQQASVANYRARGYSRIPKRGPFSISVPGVVKGWVDSLNRWGTRPLSECLRFAITLADTGVALDESDTNFYSSPIYEELVKEFPALAEAFLEPARYSIGMPLKQPRLAETLRELATKGASTFYEGDLADALLTDLKKHAALLSAEDLKRHQTLFQDTLAVTYRGRRVHTAPPNSQGVALALLLGLSEHQLDHRDGAFNAAAYMAAKRHAFHLRDRYVCDPKRTRLPPDLLSDESLNQLVQRDWSQEAEAPGGGGDTSTLVVIDGMGNAVSWVQSLFDEFGSGVVSNSTGIVLQNRLHLEQLSDDRVRGLTPGLRPFHTLCPAMVLHDGYCELVIATPGDHGQPQTIFQVLRNIYVEGLSVQAAIERPRIRHDYGSAVMVEERATREWLSSINDAGYGLEVLPPWSSKMGGVTAIQRTPEGILMGGGDPRRSSYAVAGGP